MRPARILLVEDSPADTRIIQEIFEESRILTGLEIVPDGAEALDYLYRRGKHAGAERPDLILLDLNLPRVSGLEILSDIKQDPELRRIPTVVLTTSREEQDVLQSYDLHANSFITKPVDFEQFLNVMRQLEGFWFSVVTLPPKADQ